MQQRINLQVQTPTSPATFKSYTFDALANLTQKIHELSEFEHKNYFSTTATHFRIKKGTQFDKGPQQPPSQEGIRKGEPKFRVIKTAGEGSRNKAKLYKSALKQKEDNIQPQIQSGSDLNFFTISNYNSQVMGSWQGRDKNVENHNNNFNITKDINKRTFSSNQNTTKSLKFSSTGNIFFRSSNNEKFVSLIEMDNQDEVVEGMRGQTRNKAQQHAQILIQNPTQFYHLKSVGFKNYKYPRPPQADQMYSPDSRHRIPLYLVKDPIRGDSNSIESVCVQKVQQDKYIYQSLCDSIQNSKDNNNNNDFLSVQQNNNFASQTADDAVREVYSRGENVSNILQYPYGTIDKQQDKIKKSSNYGNKLLFEMNQYNRMVNLHNLELKIEQKNNQIPHNIFSRWKSRDSRPSTNAISTPFMSEQTSPKNSILKNHNPNLKVVQIDKIDMSNDGGDRSKIRSSIQAVKLNQQSKSKKLTTIIEMYNKLVRISEKYRQSGMILEGESPTKQNKLRILELADESKAKIFKNQQQIYLGVFVQSYEILQDNKKGVTNRILLALGLDPEKEFSYVTLEQIIAFYRILIHRDSAISETIKFLEKFFKEKNQDLEKNEFKKVIKQLCQQVDEKKADYQKTLYSHFIDKFEDHGLIDLLEDNVNFKKFKQMFLSNALNIYDIIDLICGVRE